MKKDSAYSFMSTAVGIVFLFLFPFVIQGQSLEEMEKNLNSTSQTENERQFKDSLELIEKVDLESLELFRPYLLDIDPKGNVAFYDFGRHRIIYFYSDQFNAFLELGDGRGGGPREFGQVFDLKFDTDGDIWVADKNRHRISEWTRLNKLKSEFRTDKFVRPGRMAMCNNQSLFILSSQYGPDGILHRITQEGEIEKSFQKIDNEVMRSVFITDGELACDENGDLYYAGRHKEFIRKYNKSGRLLYSKSIIGFEPNESIITVEENGNVMRRSARDDVRRASGDIQVIDSELYVGYSGKKDTWLRSIDVYNAKNGEYKYSYPFSVPVKEFAIKDDEVFMFEYGGEAGKLNLAIYKKNN